MGWFTNDEESGNKVENTGSINNNFTVITEREDKIVFELTILIVIQLIGLFIGLYIQFVKKLKKRYTPKQKETNVSRNV